MKVLVIPDVHLKPYMFGRASEIMEEEKAEKAVCLMDLADDFHQEFNLDLYAQTYDAAIQFAKDHPGTLWCYGNHDLCYPWQQRESGYSPVAARTVCEKLDELKHTVPDSRDIAYIHRIDNVLFCHGGLADAFVQKYVPEELWDEPDQVLEIVSSFGPGRMWQDLSPIWYRPQFQSGLLYKEETFLHVVGHTPVTQITKNGNLISCDVFSTYRDGTPYGTCEYLLLDTETWEFHGVD